MCALCSQMMSLLDAVKDTVAVETQDLNPPGLDAKPEPCISLQAAGGWGCWEERHSQALRSCCSLPMAPPSGGGCPEVLQDSHFSMCHPLVPHLHPCWIVFPCWPDSGPLCQPPSRSSWTVWVCCLCSNIPSCVALSKLHSLSVLHFCL